MLAQIALLFLPVAATCGWFMGRSEKSHESDLESAKLHHGYFKGLNYLINEQPDKAVDVFIKLLEVDTDTVETHLALGNLFRRRGEVDRAIRVHQNLIARPQLDRAYRVQALSALGQDYLSAGVLDRAERLFLELVEMGEENSQSLRFLLHIYQQEKDWDKAITIANKLAIVTSEPMDNVVAQYHCELAEQMCEAKRYDEAQNFLKRAQAIDHSCVRASMIRGRIEAAHGQYKEAIRCYKRVREQDPDFISEIITPLGNCYRALEAENKYVEYLQACLLETPRISVVLAISDYLQRSSGDKAAIEFIAKQIRGQPSLRGLEYLVKMYLQNSHGDAKDKLGILEKIINTLIVDKPIYRCVQCGFSGKTLFWICPKCHSWTTVRPIQGVEGS